MLRRLRSFQRGTVGLCRSTGCKDTSCQSWRSEKNPAALPTSNHTSAARVRFPDDRIILQLWQPVTLQPVDLQTPTVPLWKYLNLLKNSSSTEKTKRIFNTSYALSKWPTLHRAYVISGCIFFWLAVNTQLMHLVIFQVTDKLIFCRHSGNQFLEIV